MTNTIYAQKLKKKILKGCFNNMRNRCENLNNCMYYRYGGRGIKVEWNSFKEFYNDMESEWFFGATIDRIDNDGNYTKENCQWITRSENTKKRLKDSGHPVYQQLKKGRHPWQKKGMCCYYDTELNKVVKIQTEIAYINATRYLHTKSVQYRNQHKS